MAIKIVKKAVIITKAPEISLDLAARRVIASCMLYYGLDESILSDGEFDDLCGRLSEHWDELDLQRQLSLGSPADIKTSGYGVKITSYAENAAVGWLISANKFDPKGKKRVVHTQGQQYLGGLGRWRPPSAYAWHIDK